MPGSTVDWTSAETWEHVVASMYASGIKLDLRSVAKYFGCTYDTIENRLRKTKKLADTLKQQVDSGKRGEVTPSKPRNRTPRSGALNSVATGRVSKSTPSKKKTSTVVQEHFSIEEDMAVDSSGVPGFDHIPFEFAAHANGGLAGHIFD